MTSLSMPEQVHGHSPQETVAMASDEPQSQLTGLGDPKASRSDAATMVTTGGAGDGEEVMGAEGPLDFVLVGTPWGLLLAPTPLASMKQDEEVVSAPPCPEKTPAVANGAKQCVQCGATETPQWRIQPTGRGALCNACRIRLRPAEALREKVHVHAHRPSAPAPGPATSTAISEPPADGWISGAWMDFDAHLLKVTPPPPARRQESPSPTTEPAPEKKTRKRKPSTRRCQAASTAASRPRRH